MIHPYGEAPGDLGPLDLPDWQEFMHYLYLPVRIPVAHVTEEQRGRGWPDGAWGDWTEEQELGAYWAVPERLAFLTDVLARVVADARETAPHLSNPLVYVTARRGFATPGNPLNRPGWHCDDFGGRDLNYIWSDAYPTRILRSTYPLPIPADDSASMAKMAEYEQRQERTGVSGMTDRLGRWWIEDAPVGHLLRLTPYVIHDTPVIPEPGGMRSFFKISVSEHRYNLIGNSHNHLLDYDWPMHDRAVVRNQPNGNSDYVIEERGDVASLEA